jgi:hypothetical protein
MKSLLIPSLTLLALASCASSPKTGEAPDPGTPAQEAPKKEAKDLTGLQNKVDYAHRELRIAELDMAARLTKSQQSVAQAERGLLSATEEFETYKALDIPNEEESSKLRIDRADHSRIIAQQSNEELNRMFAKEGEAASEDPVLQKSARELDFANRAVAQAQRAKSMKLDIEVPRKRRKLEWAKQQAENELEAARGDLEKTRLSIELELLRKRHSVEAAEKALEEASGTPKES